MDITKPFARCTYCYAHLSPDTEYLDKEFLDDREMKSSVSTFVPLLAQAMGLRNLPISDRQFYRWAGETEQAIINAVEHSARHPGIQRIQRHLSAKLNSCGCTDDGESLSGSCIHLFRAP
ncbi:hypothetical protein HQ563_05315 [bacterium]|nr:hypothetical protein [bacterium]